MVDVSLKIDSKAFEKAAKDVPNLLRQSLAFRFKNIGDEFKRQMVKRFTASLSGDFKSNNTKNKLANRTGALQRSYAQRVIAPSGSEANDLVLRATMGNARTADYVFIQEGTPGKAFTTVKPKGTGKLTVPMPDNLTATGRARFKRASDVEGLFKITAKSGKEFLVRKSPSGDGLEFLWILKDSVRIPARLGFVKTWNSKGMRRVRAREINEGVQKALAKAGLA